MKNLYIVKTGWEMFDLSRAYGLGILLWGLSGGDVRLSDKNYWYEITSPKIQKIKTEKLTEFLREDLSWNELGREVQAKKELIRDFFKNEDNISNIIDIYSDFKVSEIPTPEGITLYGTMEGRAIKGIREEILLKRAYSEGENIRVSKDDWMLSLLGHLNITIWKYKIPGWDELLAAMPIPSFDGTKIEDLYYHIRSSINSSIRKIHQAGIVSTLAFIGVEVVRLTLRESPLIYAPQFSSILYNNLTSTGRGMTKRWKPTNGGIFPLEFLNELGKSQRCREIMNQWIEVFNKTNFRAGYEELAIYLAEFIAYPSMEALERYLKTHLRFSLRKDIKINLYEEKILKEVIQYV